jgi:hypothetical protein
MSLTPFTESRTQITFTASSSNSSGGGAQVILSRFNTEQLAKYLLVIGDDSNTDITVYVQDPDTGSTIETVTVNEDYNLPSTPTNFILTICENELTLYDENQTILAGFNGSIVGNMLYVGVSNQNISGTSITLTGVDQNIISNFCVITSHSTSSSSSVVSEGLSAGAIAGIVIGVVLGVALIAGLGGWLGYRYYKKKKNSY